jgi:hypothetical protein
MIVTKWWPGLRRRDTASIHNADEEMLARSGCTGTFAVTQCNKE